MKTSAAVKRSPAGKQKTPKSGKKASGQTLSPKIGKTPPSAMSKGSARKQTPMKVAMKGKKGGPPKKKLEELSESDVESDEDFGLDGEEFGPLSDDESSDETEELSFKEGKMDVDEEEDDSDDAPPLVSSKPLAKKNIPQKGQSLAKANGEYSKEGDKDDSSRTIFVGNLPSKVNDEEVKKLFASCGNVENVKLISHKNYGFVIFSDAMSVEAALKEQEFKLNNQLLRVARRAAKESKTAEVEVDRSKGIYVGNMPFSLVSEDFIKELFSGCGEISSVIISRNKGGKPRGSAVVNFTDSDSVQTALQKSGTQIEGRTLVVRPSGETSRTVQVQHIRPGLKGIFGAAKCIKDLVGEPSDIIALAIKRKEEHEYSATVEFDSADSAKRVLEKSGTTVGQGPVVVELTDRVKQKASPGKPSAKKMKVNHSPPSVKKPLFSKKNNKAKPDKSPKNQPQLLAQDKSAALKEKKKQKFQKKKEASKKKIKS